MWNGKHEVTIEWIGVAAGGQVGKCTCGQRQDQPTMQRQEAEMWGDKHLMSVKAGALYTGARKPALKTLVAYYEEQASDSLNTRRDRGLWQQLADELRRTLPKLKNDPHDPNQMTLDLGIPIEGATP